MEYPTPKKYIKILSELGITKAQSILYFTSLKHGVLSVLELAKLTKISRQQVYDEADELVIIGLYDITKKQGRKYIPAPPDKLIDLAAQKVRETKYNLQKVSSIIGSLEAISLPEKDKVKIKYYEGIDKINFAYKRELKAARNTEVLSFAGSIDNLFKFFPEKYWEKWNKQFVSNGATSRMLVHKSKESEKTSRYDKKYKRETRWLSQFPLKVNIDTFNDVVLIVSFHDEIAIWIESLIISQSYRVMFEELWKGSNSYK